MADLSAAEVVELLGLEPLPEEGGRWVEAWRDEHSNAIYFLLQPDDFSALHRLTSTELWHHYAGAPVELLLLSDSAGIARPRLGVDLAAGERPVLPVPARTWMGASTTGRWSLVGTTVSPPFEWSGFELGDRADLTRRFPAAAQRIEQLTRP